MAENMECETCGGIDFYKESGYFYCKECNIQSQEVRELEFQMEISTNTKGTKKVSTKLDKSGNNITSWECYNIVLCSLTDQLIRLGADNRLKKIVKYIWLRYLEKLEVLDLKIDRRPKMQLVNSRKDIAILYGQGTKKRKRKKSNSGQSVSTTDKSSLKREMSKKKQALVQAHYEQFSQKSSQEVPSLQNETLTSLKSGSEKSSNTPISFNRYSLSELKRRSSWQHRKKHKLDFDQKLTCHKLTYKSFSTSFFRKHDLYILSPIKLYCILYLGLLINRDKIQLGDLFRFIREGHINLNNYSELFPEEYSDKVLNIQNTIHNGAYSTKRFRVMSAKLAIFLDVVKFIDIPDIEELCFRYCKELNLPEDIYVAVKNLISRTRPKLKFGRKNAIIPDYEGRTMSIILFTLKLLFGLDGVTEYHLSKCAQYLNQVDVSKPKMFDVANWIQYIGYRNLIINEYHFPSSYKNDSDIIDSTLFLNHMKYVNKGVEKTQKLSKEMNSYKELLTKLIDLQNDDYIDVEFPPTLTPFLDYTKILLSNKRNNFEEILQCNYNNNSLDFLLRPRKYLQLISDSIKYVHGGANDNWVMEHMETFFKTQNHNLCVAPIELISSGDEILDDDVIYIKKHVNKQKNPAEIKKNFEQFRGDIFLENELFERKVSEQVHLDVKEKTVGNKKECYTHFNPYERYWLLLLMTADSMGKSNWEKFFPKYPHTFKLIFKECARIIEQSCQEFIVEFGFNELFLVYGASYCYKHDKPKSKKLLDSKLNHYVNKAESYW